MLLCRRLALNHAFKFTGNPGTGEKSALILDEFRFDNKNTTQIGLVKDHLVRCFLLSVRPGDQCARLPRADVIDHGVQLMLLQFGKHRQTQNLLRDCFSRLQGPAGF